MAALTSANHSNYPIGDARLTFSGTNSISSASATINLYRRDINIAGTSDSPILQTATATYYMQKYVGTFVGHGGSLTNAAGLTMNALKTSVTNVAAGATVGALAMCARPPTATPWEEPWAWP